MQFTPTLSVDLLSPGRPISPSADTAGQDGAFANHLAVAVQGQVPSSRSPETLPTQESSPTQTEATTPPDAAIPAVPTESPSDMASAPPLADPVAVIPEDILDGSSGDPAVSAALNGSAGALNAAILPIQWAGLDHGRFIDQDFGQTGEKSSSIVARMLTTITSAGQQTATTTTTLNGQAVPPNPISPPVDVETALPGQPAPGFGFPPLANGNQRNIAAEAASPTDGSIARTGETMQNLEATIRQNIPAQGIGSEAAPATPAATIDLTMDKGQATQVTPPAQTLATETPVTATSATIDLAMNKGQATPPAQTASTKAPATTTATNATIDLTVDKGQTTSPGQTLATKAPATATTAAIDLNQAGESQATPPPQTLATKAPVTTATTAVTDLNQAGDKGQAVAPVAPLATGAASPATTPPADRVGQPPASDQIVQNQYGQIITIHQAGDSEETADPAGVAGKTAPPAAGGQIQDINSNYIRSHLPNETPKTVTNEPSTQQQETGKDNQPKGANLVESLMEGPDQTDETGPQRPQFTLGSENQPLIFASQSTKAALAGSTSSTDALTLRLPSGLNVAAGTVVDQMATHFANTRPLESGTVNLKLHPQELGELRMEIKVEQDNIKAHIIAQNPQAQEMIDRHLPRLREALAQQGLHLQHIEVTVASNDQNGGQRFQDNTRQQLGQSMHKGTGQSPFTLDPDEETTESTSSVNNLSVLA